VSSETRHLAVLGSPISHTKSPQLHRAAYAELGLPWQYDAIDVNLDALPAFVQSRDSLWRGLSLTMPLKSAVLPLLGSLDEAAQRTDAANTIYFDRSARKLMLRGFNTDVSGIVSAFRTSGVEQLSSVQLLGSGATAASALFAVSTIGAERVVVSARTPSHAGALERMAATLGLHLEVRSLSEPNTEFAPDAVISTIPGGADSTVKFTDATMERAVLLEVAYDPWPTGLAASWLTAGGRVISGLEMLLHQALAQVRIFVGGDSITPLVREAEVLAAMRRSITVD
jgi:shikimate dehydrogenase